MLDTNVLVSGLLNPNGPPGRILDLMKSDLLPDADDLPFAEVAISGKADSLVRGNTKHFQAISEKITILSPAEFIKKLT